MANNSTGQREHWGTRLGFILAAAGSAIGLGSVWKFPYITFDNGGGAFVIVYLICICLVGIPIMIAEIMIGKKTNLNPIGAFAALRGKTWWPIVGWMGLAAGFIILSYYTVIAGWTLEYVIKALMGTFKGLGLKESQDMFVGFLGNPYKQIGWHFGFSALTALIILGGVSNGIERWNKILMPFLFLIIIALMIYSLSTGAANQAFKFLFHFSFKELTPHGCLEALGHSFFTLSLGMGAMITYGSYLKREEEIVTSSILITFFDTFISICACLVMYPIIFMANVSPQEVKSIGIIFTAIPTILAGLPGGSFVGFMFFVLVAFTGLVSAISLLEVVVACAVDQLKWKRTKATLLSALVIFLFGIPSALSNGGVGWISKIVLFPKGGRWLNWLDSFDYLASNWFLPLGGLLIALFAGWVLTRQECRVEFLPNQSRSFLIWRLVIRYITPGLVLIVLLNKIGVINL